jgi:RNA polymerase sigma factor (sigma-70 family)
MPLTYEQKIEWLKSYRALDGKIESMTEQLQVWNARATKITATISQEPKAAGSGDQLQRCIDQICELQTEIAQEMDKLRKRKQEIETAIHGLNEKSYQDILWYRYIQGMTFEEIAIKMNYSWRQVCRKHKNAVEKLKMS